MSNSWDPETYRVRAMQWRHKAAMQLQGKERDICLVIAEGYADLAALIERNNIKFG